MLLGALRPGLIAGVVLNDIGPVIEGTGLARIKKYLSAKRSLPSWDAAIAAVREIGGTHFPALSEEDWRSSAEAAFAATPKGLVPEFDPNLLRTLEGIDFSEKIPVLWPQYASLSRVPVLAIRGEFSDLLSPRTLTAMAERHPRFEQMTVRGQGHAPLLRDAPSLERILVFAGGCELTS
jgi:pimeloyl-ACP methyl ester carboxylesterase